MLSHLTARVSYHCSKLSKNSLINPSGIQALCLLPTKQLNKWKIKSHTHKVNKAHFALILQMEYLMDNLQERIKNSKLNKNMSKS